MYGERPVSTIVNVSKRMKRLKSMDTTLIDHWLNSFHSFRFVKTYIIHIWVYNTGRNTRPNNFLLFCVSRKCKYFVTETFVSIVSQKCSNIKKGTFNVCKNCGLLEGNDCVFTWKWHNLQIMFVSWNFK